MLHATVLGSGELPGHVIHSRRRERGHDPLSASSFNATASSSKRSTSPHTHLAQSRSLRPRSRRTDSQQAKDCYPDEVLTWHGREVTWTRGIEVVRRFSFYRDGQDVTSALFAWFKIDQITGPPSTSSSLETKDTTFGPFHTSQTAEWGALKPTSQGGPSGLTRAVVVVLETRAHVFLVTGECVRISVPFRTDGCWALPSGGLLVSRALETRRRGGRTGHYIPRLSVDSNMGDRSAIDSIDLRLEEDDTRDLPRLFTLTQLFGEFERVTEARIEGGLGDDPTPRLWASLSPPCHIKPSVTLLHVAPEPYPFIIAWDDEDKEVVVYRHANIPLTADRSEAPKSPGKRHLRPEELMRQTETLPLPSARRGRASLGRGERRVSGAAPDLLDRSRRRASRLSAAHELPVLEESDPFNEVDPFHEAASRTRANSSGAEKGRRSSGLGGASIMREELHDYGKVLGVVAEDLRETTMVMGLENDESPRSELVLDQIWSWSPPGIVDDKGIRAFLSENRSPSHVNLVLHMTLDGRRQLFTFEVQLISSPRPRYIFSELRANDSLAAVPIKATRRDVLDVLSLDSRGELHVSRGSDTTISISIPDTTSEDGRDAVANRFASSLSMALDGNGASISNTRRIVDLSHASGSSVTVKYSDGSSVRISVAFAPPAGLASRTLEALSYALTAEEYDDLSATYLREASQLPVHRRGSPDSHWDVLSAIIFDKCGLAATQQERPSWNADPIMRQLARRTGRTKSDTVDEPSPAVNVCAARVLMALHLIAQDCRLSSTTEAQLALVAPLILRLAAVLGKANWVDYWTRLMPTLGSNISTQAFSAFDTSFLDFFSEPPDILTYLSRRLVSKCRPFPSPQTFFGSHSPLGSPRPCEQTDLLTAAYAHLTPGSGACDKRAVSLVTFLLQNGLDAAWVADLPFGVAMPIGELLRVCQQNPPEDASAEVYEFIGREDLATVFDLSRSTLELPMGAEDASDNRLTVGAVMGSIHGTGAKHAHYSALPHVRFGLDRRLDEVDRIMQTTRPRTVALDDPKGLK